MHREKEKQELLLCHRLVVEKQKDAEKNIKRLVENNKMNIPKIFFLFHILGIICTNFGWIFIPEILYLHPIVILSWKLNNNRCIISQVEYYLFDRTFMGEKQKFYVPRRHRYLLYTNFVLGSCYHLLS